MSFAGSTYATKITIASSQVAATQSDFAVLLSEANLPAAMLDGGATSCLNGGGDLLAYAEDPTSGEEPATRYALDVVSCDTTAGTAQIWCKVPTVSSILNTELWVAWGDPAGTQPAASDPYGRNAAWTSDAGVWAFENDPSGSAPQLVDRTGSGYSGTSEGTMTSGDLIAGEIGKAWDFDGIDDAVNCGTGPTIGTSDFTVRFWMRSSSAANSSIVTNYPNPVTAGFNIEAAANFQFVTFGGSGLQVAGATRSLFINGSWTAVTCVRDSSGIRLYSGSTLRGSSVGTSGDIDAAGKAIYMARRRDTGTYMATAVDMLRISLRAWGTNDVITHHNNESSPGTFATNNGVNAISSAAATTFPFYYWYQ